MKKITLKQMNVFALFLIVFALYSVKTSLYVNAAPKGSTTNLYFDEYYYIVSAIDYNKVIDVKWGGSRDGTNIQLYKKNGSNSQLFKMVRNGNGYVSFINKGTNKALDINNCGTSNGTNVQLWSRNSSSAQKWKIYKKGKRFSIKAKCGKYLDVNGCSSRNGTNIQIWEGNSSLAQLFYFVPYVRYTTTTVDLGNFKTIDEWRKAITAEQHSVTFGGSLFTNPSGKTYYNGRIIIGMTTLTTRTITTKISRNTLGYYSTVKVKLPKKIRFKLHSHNTDVKMWFDFSALKMYQQCECGFHDAWQWDIPYWENNPGPTANWQNTQSTINAIKPRHYTYRINY